MVIDYSPIHRFLGTHEDFTPNNSLSHSFCILTWKMHTCSFKHVIFLKLIFCGENPQTSCPLWTYSNKVSYKLFCLLQNGRGGGQVCGWVRGIAPSNLWVRTPPSPSQTGFTSLWVIDLIKATKSNKLYSIKFTN